MSKMYEQMESWIEREGLAEACAGHSHSALDAVSFTMDDLYIMRMLSSVPSNAKHHPYQTYMQRHIKDPLRPAELH